MQYRRRLHCAPLATEGYRFRTYDGPGSQSHTTYHYGGLQNVNGNTTLNYTARFSNNFYVDVEELTHVMARILPMILAFGMYRTVLTFVLAIPPNAVSSC